MKFDFIIGNPPYQDDTVGEQKTFAPQIYHLFMDGAYNVAEKVELIHPARFLFNAGGTPKDWNTKMLNDEHFKVIYYEANGRNIFPNTDIKGGIAITYRDASKNFGAIMTYTAYDELNSAKTKVVAKGEPSITKIISNRGLYRFSDLIYVEHPADMEKFTDSRISANSFERLPELFTKDKNDDGQEYVQIYGRIGTERAYRWFRKDYIKIVDSFYKYKVMVPAANGSGAIGEVLSTPVIGQPMIGHTETFLTFGCFDTLSEAENLLKYLKGKFSRAMLGILKITQHNSKPVWRYVPLQDFTSSSDIDWSVSIPEIDRQLYAKYGLDESEIEFIETHVKEMA